MCTYYKRIVTVILVFHIIDLRNGTCFNYTLTTSVMLRCVVLTQLSMVV